MHLKPLDFGRCSGDNGGHTMLLRLYRILFFATALFLAAKTPGAAGVPDFSRFVGLKAFPGLAQSPKTNGPTVWLSPEIKAGMNWNQLVVSWNATAPAGTFLKIEARAVATNHATRFFTLGIWSPDNQVCPRTSVRDQKDSDGEVMTDTLVLNRLAQAAQLRVTLGGTTASAPALKFIGLSFCNPQVVPVAQSPDRSAWGKIIPTPELSQFGSPQEKGWCSPTSLAMVLARWAEVLHRPELKLAVPAVAAAVYDRAYDGTGNWPFNTAFAGSFDGLCSYVTRFSDLSEVEAWIAAGIPVILSVRWDLLQTGRRNDPSGHLVVCIGFTKNGDVVVNEPATKLSQESVRRIYQREDVLRAWDQSHHTVYLVYPEAAAIPVDRFGHWER